MILVTSLSQKMDFSIFFQLSGLRTWTGTWIGLVNWEVFRLRLVPWGSPT